MTLMWTGVATAQWARPARRLNCTSVTRTTVESLTTTMFCATMRGEWASSVIESEPELEIGQPST